MALQGFTPDNTPTMHVNLIGGARRSGVDSADLYSKAEQIHVYLRKAVV